MTTTSQLSDKASAVRGLVGWSYLFGAKAASLPADFVSDRRRRRTRQLLHNSDLHVPPPRKRPRLRSDPEARGWAIH
nr:hypothetical protein Iba_chr12cCG21930 [Ipomoea batatas]